MFALPHPRLVQLSGETSSRVITLRTEALGRSRAGCLARKERKGVRGGRKVNRYIRDRWGRCMYYDWAVLDGITGRAQRAIERREKNLRGIESEGERTSTPLKMGRRDRWVERNHQAHSSCALDLQGLIGLTVDPECELSGSGGREKEKNRIKRRVAARRRRAPGSCYASLRPGSAMGTGTFLIQLPRHEVDTVFIAFSPQDD